MDLTKNSTINHFTPHCFICQMPMTEANWSVMMMPKIIGTKSPSRLMEGINNRGKDPKISTMAIDAVMVMMVGRVSGAMI